MGECVEGTRRQRGGPWAPSAPIAPQVGAGPARDQSSAATGRGDDSVCKQARSHRRCASMLGARARRRFPTAVRIRRIPLESLRRRVALESDVDSGHTKDKQCLRFTRQHPRRWQGKPTLVDVAQAIGSSPADVHRLLMLGRGNAISLNTPLEPPSLGCHKAIRTLMDTFPDEATPEPAARVQEEDVLDRLECWLAQLSEKQCQVLTRRFGLQGCEHATLEELGQEMGVTRERVRQIQNEALAKLRRIVQRAGYTEDSLLG
jgi:DNA-directed RNA polymerase sigma subunit (sigma70/sigma32)